MNKNVNYIALAGGIATLVLIIVSVFVPWWQFTVGNPALAQVNVSPMNLNFSLLGTAITIPLILAINIAALLTMLSGGIAMLIYALKPNKPYSKKILGFGYKKPLIAVIIFIVGIIALVTLANSLSGFNVPVVGGSAMKLPANMSPDGMSISVNVLAAFGWPFYFAIVASALCLAAKFYHKKIPLEGTVAPPIPSTA
jgi:hypothetical protein